MKNYIKNYFDKFFDVLVRYIFRKRSLNYILYTIVLFFLRELAALSASEPLSTFFQEIRLKNPDSYLYWLSHIGDILFTSGSYVIAGIEFLLILVIIFLKRAEIAKKSWDKYEQVIEDYREVNKERKKQIEKLEENINEETLRKKELEKFLEKVNTTLQKENISKEDLIRYTTGRLKCIILYKSYETGEKIIRDEIYPALNVVNIVSGLCAVPPNSINQKMTDKEIVNNFLDSFKELLPADYEYNLPIISVIDLASTTYSKHLQDFRRFKDTFIDKLDYSEIFQVRDVERYLLNKKKISSRDIIEIPNITFLVEDYLVPLNDYKKLEENNNDIVADINNRLNGENITTTEFSNLDRDTLIQILDEYVDESEIIADRIISNGTFWKNYFEN